MTETTATTDGRPLGEAPGVDRLAPEPPRQAGVERFDEAIVVTRARAWVGLVACLILVVGLIVWAATATVESTIESPGVALEHGAIAIVRAAESGTISQLRVRVGEHVAATEVLADMVADDGTTLEIRAPIAGRVLSVSDAASPVARGDDAFTLVPESGRDVVRTLVTSTEAQVINSGTRVILRFPGAPEFEGRVSSVGAFPLPTNQVVDDIGGEPIAAEALRKDARDRVDITISGLDGARFPLPSGDIGQVTFIIGSRHPIDYVL